MRGLICILVSLLFLTWAATALAAHETHSGVAPASWMATTCTALSTLQHGIAGRWSGTASVRSRVSLSSLLARDATDANGVVAATKSKPSGLPHAGAIASALHARGLALQRYVAARRAAALHGNVSATAAAAQAGLLARSKQVGATFVHLERSFPSDELAAAIDQAPSCALVHG